MNTFVRAAFVAAFALLLLLGGCSRENAAPLLATIGKPAPTFTLTDIEGRTWSLAELRGKVVFVNFWATWCPPCREEMPSMEALNRSMAGQPFQMLTVLVNDDPALARRFLAMVGGTFPVLVPADDSVAKAYGITGVPETFIVDPQGILREKYVGGRAWDSDGAKQMLRSYFP